MTSIDTLILDLSADLAPVKRRSLWRDSSLLLALGLAELVLVVGAGLMRPDMGRMIHTSFMAWKLGSLTLLAAVACTVALRSFAPPASSRRGLRLTMGLAGLAIVAGTAVASAVDRGRPLLDRLSPMHGIICAASIVLLALPMMAMLAVLMRRAAPVQPQQGAIAAGLAASSCGALLFSICCPMNDPLYIIVWYSVGMAATTAASRWLLPRRFRL
jgi:hypothetical protein